MSIFAKKSDPKSDARADGKLELELDVAPEIVRSSKGGRAPAYGIADAMQLLRSLPVDQNLELVIRVVRVTLNSLNVRVEDIIEDATRKQKSISDTVAALHGQVADLEKQLEARRREIAAHEADLKETTSVKERLLLAEKSAGHWPPPAPASGPISSFSALPPPLPLPRATVPKPAEREDSGQVKGS